MPYTPLNMTTEKEMILNLLRRTNEPTSMQMIRWGLGLATLDKRRRDSNRIKAILETLRREGKVQVLRFAKGSYYRAIPAQFFS